MDWHKGFTASCYMSLVDRATWRDAERIEITDGKISRSGSGLLESAQVECVRYDQSAERWVRIWMDARQEGTTEHVALFTGLAVSPDRNIDGRLSKNDVTCYSVLKPAKDVLLPRGWYAPAGARGAELAARLLAVTPAPKVVEDGSPLLSGTYIAEDGESNLSMAQKILEAINWRLRIEGDGKINICPKATEPVVTFDNLQNDSIEPKVKTSYDWFSAPNVVRVIKDGMSATARDDSEESIFSTRSRQREIWLEEDNCNLNAAESLEAYAKRRLRESQNVAYTVSYDRRFNPDVLVSDAVTLRYPEQDINGIFKIKRQTIDLSRGGRTSETGEMYGDF